MNLRNRVQLIGRIGNTPEIKEFNEGKKLIKFNVATNEYYRDAEGNKQQSTTWHNIVAWGKLAEIMEKTLTKGDEITLEGKLISRNWEDNEGKKHYITEVQVSEYFKM